MFSNASLIEQSHNTMGEKCWCDPEIEVMENGSKIIIHQDREESMQVEDIARVCHEANKGLCETQGDFSQLPYDYSPQWLKDSIIIGVVFNLAHPDAPASAY